MKPLQKVDRHLPHSDCLMPITTERLREFKRNNPFRRFVLGTRGGGMINVDHPAHFAFIEDRLVVNVRGRRVDLNFDEVEVKAVEKLPRQRSR